MASTTSTTTEDIIGQLNKITDNVPDSVVERRKITAAAKALLRKTEPMFDQTNVVLYSHLTLPIVVTAVDIGLLQLLGGSPGKEFGIAELVKETKCKEELLVRLLRYLAADNIIDEVKASVWTGNPLTANLVTDVNLGGIKHQYYSVGPIYNILPAFLKRQNYQNAGNPSDGAFQMGHHTDKSAFEWMGEHPDNLGYFMAYMQTSRIGKSWTETDLPGVIAGRSAGKDTVLFVDMGGNVGSVAVDLRKRIPVEKGRIIIQDLAHVVPGMLKFEGVEPTAHDFFTEQTVKGAKVYYLRTVLHDWPDEKCRDIVKNIMPAMSDDSEIWLDEKVIPDQGATRADTIFDWTMLAAMAAMERTESHWKRLLNDAGLEKVSFRMVDETEGTFMIVASKS